MGITGRLGFGSPSPPLLNLLIPAHTATPLPSHTLILTPTPPPTLTPHTRSCTHTFADTHTHTHTLAHTHSHIHTHLFASLPGFGKISPRGSVQWLQSYAFTGHLPRVRRAPKGCGTTHSPHKTLRNFCPYTFASSSLLLMILTLPLEMVCYFQRFISSVWAWKHLFRPEHIGGSYILLLSI